MRNWYRQHSKLMSELFNTYKLHHWWYFSGRKLLWKPWLRASFYSYIKYWYVDGRNDQPCHTFCCCSKISWLLCKDAQLDILTCTWEQKKRCHKLQYRSKRDILQNKIFGHNISEKNGQTRTLMVELLWDYMFGSYSRHVMVDQLI